MRGREKNVADDSSDLPDTLFHYTSQDGLLGICSSRSIFATKVQYLNDEAEFRYGLDLARDAIGDLGGPEDLAQVVDAIHHANIFVSSLTEEADLLSQWRAYGTPGHRFSLGLRSAVLRQVAEIDGWTLQKCIYLPADQKQAVNDVVNRAVELAKRKRPYAGRFREELIGMASRLKDPSFIEENEWRLVSPLIREGEGRIRYRSGGFTLIAYVEFSLVAWAPKVSDRSVAISEVIVGPTPHPDLSLRAVAAMLRAHGLKGTVRTSKSSFRDW